MKRILFVLLVLVALITAVSANGAQETTSPASPAKEEAKYNTITLKFGTSSAESSLTAKAFKDWGARLDKATNGAVKVDVYCSSVLGNNTEMTQGAQMGTIDVVVIQPSGLADMGAKRMNVLVLPYLFKDYDQYYKTLYGKIGDELLGDITKNIKGLVGFSYLADGGRCYFNNGRPIKTIQDIKGMKLRVQSYAIDSSTAKAIGFSATPTALSELYSALQTGVVDGAEQPLSAIDGNAFYEVAKYLVLDNHTYNIPTLVVSAMTWNKLNDATKVLLKEKWIETVEQFFKPSLKDYEASLLKKFQTAGMQIVNIEDYNKWVEAVAPVWKQYGAGLEDIIAQIQAQK